MILRTFVRSFAMLGIAMLAACAGNSGGVQTEAVPVSQSLRAETLLESALPRVKNVVVVMMENRDYDLVIGSPDAPYINNTLVPEAALLTNSHAIGHPSQPNYLAIFSGSTQGITDDSCPHSFATQNLGAELIAKAGLSFAGYAESMPSNGYTGCTSGEYARKHVPWVNFTNVPASSDLVYTGFPKKPPTVSFVIPNLCDDMHDCSTQAGDTWLSTNLPPILKYNAKHDGLLILTWDEASPDSNGKNQVATLLLGPSVKPGAYAQDVTHYSVLHTIESLVAVPCTANACTSPPLKGLWK